MTLILGDSFNIFREYLISEKEIFSTYNNPERLESLDNNVRLYLKSFNNKDNKRLLLLIGTQLIKNEEILAFSYWIPSEYNLQESSLLNILEIFTNQFGFKIRIGEKEAYLIRYSERFISGKIINPNSLIKVLTPEQIPCEYFIFTSENLIGTLNKVSIYYAFAINKGKYFFWVNSFPTIKLEIKSGWYDFVKNNFVDFIQPNGQTKIKINKQKTTENLEKDKNNKMAIIEVPSIYKNQFTYITKQINKLKNNEKIIFSISLESPKCLFCPSVDTSKEHIFPKWLRPYLKETAFEGTQFSKFGDESLKKVMGSATSQGKKESSHGYTVKIVCNNCNNTWMSQLESEVKPIITNGNKLIDKIPNNISRKDAEIISLWLIVKSLLLSNKTFTNIHLIKKQVFENLKNRKIDSGFLVEYISAINPKFNFYIGKGLLHDNLIRLRKISLEKGKEMTTNFFTCCIQLNHLLFRISYLEPSLPFRRETALRQTLKLFPYGEKSDHRAINNDNMIWEKIVNDGIELHLFGMGLLLVEQD